MNNVTNGYQHCIDDIDLDWIGHASDEDITNCFNDLVKAGVLASDLKDVTNTELQRFWLIYQLEDETTPYPLHIEDDTSYHYYCGEQAKHYEAEDYQDPYTRLTDDDDTPF